ncbi:MAG: TIGR01244 family sulfur transferase [Pontibacterium sp.]
MNLKQLDNKVSVSDQITSSDVSALAAQGVDLIICNRPDNEAADQPSFESIKAAADAAGVNALCIPFVAGKMSPEQVNEFKAAVGEAKRVHAYCRTGNRSSIIYNAGQEAPAPTPQAPTNQALTPHYQVVIVGAGSGGIAVAASLLKRDSQLRIALIDPATKHYYQPGWTMVGGGVFDAQSTERNMSELIPSGVEWLKKGVASFVPEQNKVVLDDNSQVEYEQLVIAPGLKLDWGKIEGLEETLGKNGVTSNYRFDLAPYTWELAKSLKSGTAIFTQPPMPIKCAGAPQKALYLSADHWLKTDALNNINIKFCNAGPGLFGVPDYVPVLKSYMEKYGAELNFGHNLVKVDGLNKVATFKVAKEDGEAELVEMSFDMLHVCPVQCAPEFIANSPLSDDAGWLDVNPNTLQSTKAANIWGLGDATNTANAKTMAAVRQQAPVVAQNIIDAFAGSTPSSAYLGYGSCPLTVERGKILLAEFSYGGKVTPTFPEWVNKGKAPTQRAWFLKATMLPWIYWHGMLKGREWLAAPKSINDING